uniref:Uncharacterized protein n=1 Tax=Sus scrofa TaxID=9823 RepID=A0A4X1UMK4_PIG
PTSASCSAPRGQPMRPLIQTALPHKVKRQKNRYVKSNPGLFPKGERQSLPSMEQQAAGATDSIKPAPPSQGVEAKGGEFMPQVRQKQKQKQKNKKILDGLSFKRNRKGDRSTFSPTEEEQKGEMSTCSEEGTPQERKTKGAEASVDSRGRDTEEEGPQAAEPSTPLGLESGPTPMSKQSE